MVRKISMLVCTLALVFGCAMTAQAATHSVYEGNISSSYVTYFRDILAGTSIKENYVAFRSGQNDYAMVVGELELNGDTFTLDGDGKIYRFYTETSGYNSFYRYDVTETTNFSVNVGDYVVYSDLGDFPQLLSRGDNFEVLTSVLVCIFMLSAVIARIFRWNLRR